MPFYFGSLDARSPSLLPNEIKLQSSNEFISDKAQWLRTLDRILDIRSEFKEYLLQTDSSSLHQLLECHELKHGLPVIHSQNDVMKYLSSIPFIMKLKKKDPSSDGFMNFDERFEVLKKITKMFLVTLEGLHEIHRYLNNTNDNSEQQEYFINSLFHFRIRSVTLFPYFPNFTSDNQEEYLQKEIANDPKKVILVVEHWAIPPRNVSNHKIYASGGGTSGGDHLKRIRLSLLNTPIYPITVREWNENSIEVEPGYPHYHQEKHGSATFKSTSLIGQLYDMIMSEIQNETNFATPHPEIIITALDDRDYIYVSCLYEIKKALSCKENPLDTFMHFLLTRWNLIHKGKHTIQYASEFLNIFWRVLCWVELFSCCFHYHSSNGSNENDVSCSSTMNTERITIRIHVLNSCLEDLSPHDQETLLNEFINSSTTTSNKEIRVMTLMGIDSVPLEWERKSSVLESDRSKTHIYEITDTSCMTSPSTMAWILEQVIESSLRMQVELGFHLHDLMKKYFMMMEKNQREDYYYEFNLSKALLKRLLEQQGFEKEFPKTFSHLCTK
nr:unnamed protein product [Naegleria fowleri]